MEIDDKYIDVSFPDDPSYVFGDTGVPLSSHRGLTYENRYGTLDESELREAYEKNKEQDSFNSYLVNWINNQGQEGSCVANADAKFHEVTQAKQFGKKNVVRISSMSLYKRIGRSASSGASVRDGIEQTCKIGLLPLDTPENRQRFKHVHPATGFNKPLPKGYEETAKMFRGREYDVATSVEGILSALACGHCVLVGREGHSILYLDLIWDGRKWLVKYVNSWGEQWGDKGFGYDTYSQISKSANWAVVGRSIVVNEDLLKLLAI